MVYTSHEEQTVISSPGPKAVALCTWIFTWVIAYKVYRSPEPLLVASTGYPMIDGAIVLACYCFVLLIGPVAYVKYSTTIELGPEWIRISTLGRKRRYYALSDVLRKEMRSKGSRATCKLTLKDGRTVAVDSYFKNFEALQEVQSTTR